MWNAITSDLNEFVSTVAGDTSEVLNRIDQNFPDGANDDNEELSLAAEERLRRMEMRETFDSQLISDDDDELYKKDVTEFLANFSVEARTEEIAKLLEDNPETLKLVFEALVPTKVTYEEFWQRYFYRCDEERINAEIEEEEKRMTASRAEAFKSISAVGSILGGAVKAVSASLTEEDKKDGTGETGFFRASKRPPFVLNTAVSEGEDDEEEEEEELGWDDDEDDGDDAADGGQIEFNDVATENLQEQLKLAVEERDQLHQTVEMQKKELASLKTAGAESSEIDKLKTQLFEKESEVAALRASMLDDSGVEGDGPSGYSAKIESLMEKLKAMAKQAEEDKNALAEVRKERDDLVSQVSSLESASKELNDEVAVLRSENVSLKNQLGDAEKRVQTLEEESRKVEELLRNKEDPGETSVDSPETVSSTVKVDKIEDSKPGDEWDDDW